MVSLVFLSRRLGHGGAYADESGGVLSELMELSQRGRWQKEAGARGLGVIEWTAIKRWLTMAGDGRWLNNGETLASDNIFP
jgi:hypothetical protein